MSETVVEEEGTLFDEDGAAIIERRILCMTEIPEIKPTDEDMRILVGVPIERMVLQKPFLAFVQIFVQGWHMLRLEYTRNDIARCLMADALLESDFTHLLMLDSDHIHPPDIVQRLARWFRAFPDKVQVVGGLNFRRGEPFDPCAFVDTGDGFYRRMAEWGQGAIEIDALGTGCVMIAREVFDGMPKPYFGYDYSKEGWPGTDMWFSERCHDAGVTLWCDTTTTSPHVADLMVTEETYRHWIERHGVPPDDVA